MDGAGDIQLDVANALARSAIIKAAIGQLQHDMQDVALRRHFDVDIIVDLDLARFGPAWLCHADVATPFGCQLLSYRASLYYAGMIYAT